MGTRFGDGIWGRDLGNEIWGRDLGTGFGDEIWGRDLGIGNNYTFYILLTFKKWI